MKVKGVRVKSDNSDGEHLSLFTLTPFTFTVNSSWGDKSEFSLGKTHSYHPYPHNARGFPHESERCKSEE